MRARWLWLALALLCAPAEAQVIPGFPPGVFDNAAALSASVAASPVAFDAKATSDTYLSNSASTITNTTLTVGSGPNRALIATYMTNSTSPVVSCSWDSAGTPQTMTKLITTSLGGGGGSSVIFGLRNPTSGNKTLSCSTDGPSQQFLSAVSFTGVNQTSDGAAFPNTNGVSGTGTAISNTVTSATNDMTVDASSNNGWNYSAPTQTQLYIDNSGTSTNSASSYASGAVTVTFGWTQQNSAAKWTDSAVDIAHQ